MLEALQDTYKIHILGHLMYICKMLHSTQGVKVTVPPCQDEVLKRKEEEQHTPPQSLEA